MTNLRCLISVQLFLKTGQECLKNVLFHLRLSEFCLIWVERFRGASPLWHAGNQQQSLHATYYHLSPSAVQATQQWAFFFAPSAKAMHTVPRQVSLMPLSQA